jgi:hypothetical protein
MTVRYRTVLYKRRTRTLFSVRSSLALPGGNRWPPSLLATGSDEAGDDEFVHESLHRVTGGRPVGDDGPKEVPGQQVPEFVGDSGIGDLTPVDGLLQHLLDQSLALIDEFMLHGVVERRVARYLDKHRADGAGMLVGLLADRLPKLQQSPRNVPVSGGTATWRMPSMNAANTNSAVWVISPTIEPPRWYRRAPHCPPWQYPEPTQALGS